MNYLIPLIIFGISPSIIWLSYYLRKDTHPEPNSMVIKIFICGMLATIPALVLAILFQMGIDWLSSFLAVFPKPTEISNLFRSNILDVSVLSFGALLMFFFYNVIGIGLVEEGSKYLVVKCKVLNDSEYDEPIDTMIYMIIAGLGFAALENILYLFPHLFPVIKLGETCVVTSFRFLGAVFLHALCSGLIGFFLALAICEGKNKLKLFLIGLITASVLHGFFDYSIIIFGGIFKILTPIAIILFLALFVSFGFQKLKKMKSTCKI